jgi:hypothetical protein
VLPSVSVRSMVALRPASWCLLFSRWVSCLSPSCHRAFLVTACSPPSSPLDQTPYHGQYPQTRPHNTLLCLFNHFIAFSLLVSFIFTHIRPISNPNLCAPPISQHLHKARQRDPNVISVVHCRQLIRQPIAPSSQVS